MKDPTLYDPKLILAGIGVGTAALACVGADVAMRIGTDQQVPINPFDAAGDLLLFHKLHWSTAATLVAAAEIGLVVLVILALGVWWTRRNDGRDPVIDTAARHMANLRQCKQLTDPECRAKAKSLGVAATAGLGVVLGKHFLSQTMLHNNWESLICVIAGPRAGKTTSLVIPAILDAPGAVLATSNKSDVVEDTRGVLTARGKTCWVFDPQKVAGVEPTWFWNPLSAVIAPTTLGADVKAKELAAHFAAASSGDSRAQTDAFFDEAGMALLTGLILAAAVGRKDITQVYRWCTRDDDREPVTLLERDWPLYADSLRSQYEATEKQRSGVFATARKMCEVLTFSHVTPWVCRTGPFDTRPEFNVESFIDNGEALYALSKEGAGAASALVTALVGFTLDAAEAKGSKSPGGRLATPMVAALDEIANVVPLKQLPNQFSHYGSRGIIAIAILQSYPQGCAVWGTEGMDKLWNAASNRIYLGGGTRTPGSDFLEALSESIGDHSEIMGSVSYSARGERSVTRHKQDRRTLTAADLAALPQGRAVLLPSRGRAVMLQPVPWWETAHGDDVTAAKAHPQHMIGASAQ